MITDSATAAAAVAEMLGLACLANAAAVVVVISDDNDAIADDAGNGDVSFVVHVIVIGTAFLSLLFVCGTDDDNDDDENYSCKQSRRYRMRLRLNN